MEPVAIGAVMRGAASSRVVASRSQQAKPGDLVSSWHGWTQYAVLREGEFEPPTSYPGVDPNSPQDLLSGLGMTSVTAWTGMNDIGEPKPGELVVISGAAGATGNVAGQIAKSKGATVVGLCGSESKARWLVDDLGFDKAINYKSPNFKEQFLEATESLIDIFFDNVGGEQLDLALTRAKPHARFVMCGGISQYNTTDPVGIKNLTQIITMRIRMQGFIAFDKPERIPLIRLELAQLLASGNIKKTETIIKGGLSSCEQGLLDLYKGVNQGKLIVEVKNPTEPSLQF